MDNILYRKVFHFDDNDDDDDDDDEGCGGLGR